MAAYRLYGLDQGNHITYRRDFDAPNDAAAIEIARAECPNVNWEIWELGRKVASLRIALEQAA